jgi:3-oxoacyl-[acyl-carrier-protein] synthase II
VRRVVVTGVGVVSPIGNGLPDFLEGLRTSRRGIGTIRSFDSTSFSSRIAGEVKDLAMKELALPEEEGPALLRDPKGLYGLAAAQEALRGAFGNGMPSACYGRDRMGLFMAAGLEIFNLADLVAYVDGGSVLGEALQKSLDTAPAFSRLQIPAHLAARCIARQVEAEGQFAVDVSACAAGTQAIGEAFWAIRDGAADMMVTGGYDSMVNPLGVGGFTLLQALSTANELGGGASRPFHAKRDGFVLGEGAAVIVLESLDGARARSAPILGEVLGFGSTMDAFRVTDPATDQRGAIGAMRNALADASISPEQVDYVNAHGTGTEKNDPAETAAIRAAFGAHADALPVSSTKSQIGHLIGAAGAVEFVATLLAIEHGFLPATINLDETDPECDLDYVPENVRDANVNVAVSNSFGFGGQNACIVLSSGR